MKIFHFAKKIFCFALVIAITLFCTLTVLAEGEDDSQPAPLQTDSVEPETEYTEPQTLPVETQPYAVTDEPTDYVSDVTDAPETEPFEPEETQEPTYVQSITPAEDATPYFEAPTLAKTVSTKQYETNNTAGIISWICVGTGIIVIAAVMISTKASGKKASARR